MKYKAAIIGLGQIGQGYDYHCNDGSLIVTHASAYHFHPAFELIGAADTNKGRCDEFEKRYDVPTFTNANELMGHLKPDVVSIATPSDSHYDTFSQIIRYAPRAIIMEKPFAEKLEHAFHMISIAKSKETVLLVNYVRRFEPGTNKLKEMIKNGYLGDIYKGNVWYCKGLSNNGSHFVDLLMYFFGDVNQINLINKGRTFWNNDPEPDFMLRFNGLEVIFQSVRSECFSLGGVTLIGTKGLVNYSNGKIEYSLAAADPVYKGYNTLRDEINMVETDFDKYQYHVIDALNEHLNDNDDLKSDGVSATETSKVVQQIISLR